MGLKIVNQGYGILASGISDTDVTIPLSAGHGARFGNFNPGDYMYATLVSNANDLEIVKITARATDSLTVTRGQDGTIAMAFSAGERLECRPCAAAFLAAFAEATSIRGMIQSQAADADHDTTISPGLAPDSTRTTVLGLTAAITKRIDAAWAEGDAAGGLFSGAVANNTEYYIHAIRKDSDGAIDVGYDVSAIAANRPGGWTFYCPIGWVKTDGSSNIRDYKAYEISGGGLDFQWDTPPLDINLTNTLTNSEREDTLSVPTAFSVLASMNVAVIAGASFQRVYIHNPDVSDQAPGSTATPLTTMNSSTTHEGNAPIRVRTSATGKIASRASLAVVSYYGAATIGFEWARR